MYAGWGAPWDKEPTMLLLGFRASRHSHDYVDTLTWDYLDDNDFAKDYFKEVQRFMFHCI